MNKHTKLKHLLSKCLFLSPSEREEIAHDAQNLTDEGIYKLLLVLQKSSLSQRVLLQAAVKKDPTLPKKLDDLMADEFARITTQYEQEERQRSKDILE